MSTDKKKLEYFNNATEALKFARDSGKVEQIYLAVDRAVAFLKKVNPDSYCISCTLTCCTNELFLPVSFIEWKSIENYLKRSSNDFNEHIKNVVSNIPKELFLDLDIAIKQKHLYKNTVCPFLINNSCSIAPYRPFLCRTYGFLKNTSNIDDTKNYEEKVEDIYCCSLEKNRRRNSFEKELFVSGSHQLIEVLNYKMSRDKTTKILIVWLKEHFNL